MTILEENFKCHLEAFASELFIYLVQIAPDSHSSPVGGGKCTVKLVCQPQKKKK